MESCIPLPLEEAVVTEVANHAKDWALLHGAVMRSKSNYSLNSVNFAPFTLLPSVYRRDAFEEVVRLQKSVNELVHKISHCHTFLESSLANTIQADEFTRKLYDIYDIVRKEGFSQHRTLGILRTDYLPHCDGQLKQVEMNTIACSFSSFSKLVTDLHRYTLIELGHEDKVNNLPPNCALSGVSDGLYRGWKEYGNPNTAVLFLVEEVTINIADQRFVEYELCKHVKTLRRTLSYIGKCATLNNQKELCVDGHVISVVYMRVGYDPSQYPTELEWNARLLIERSAAIKCPDIRLQLTGTKKIQQKLAEPGVLETFVNSYPIKRTFTGIYSLDPSDGGDLAYEMGVSDPCKYVLKPQREGGGNNVYGEEVKTKLESMEPKERQGWILMERILPPKQSNIIVKEDVNLYTDVISELGIFGYVIGDNEKIYSNVQAGHMLRTKPSNVDEGGVAAGFAALDSPFLVG